MKGVNMVSPETLRRYPFFALLDSDQLVKIAMITEVVEYDDQVTIFSENDRAETLYFLQEGCVDLYYTIVEAYLPNERKEVLVCQINPGELFGISAIIPPHELTSTARSTGHSQVMEIDAIQLKALFEQDAALQILILRRVTQAAMQRLHATRVQLAAAWS